MRRPIARIKGLGFIIWQSRHMAYHVGIGLLWAWFLRERWNQFNVRWIWLSVLGSVLPDADHLLYFWTYGKRDAYTLDVRQFLRNKQWRAVAAYLANGHKFNTNLSLHNYYFMAGLLALALVSSRIEWQAGVILFGAMLFHYIFDIIDDILMLGSINPNWRRWGRKKLTLESLKRP